MHNLFRPAVTLLQNKKIKGHIMNYSLIYEFRYNRHNPATTSMNFKVLVSVAPENQEFPQAVSRRHGHQ